MGDIGKHITNAATTALLALTMIMPATTTAASVNDDTLSYNDRRLYNYIFIEAASQQNTENYDVALELLNRSLEINPYAAEAYYARSLYFSELGMDSLAIADLQKAAALSPGNDTYVERIAQHYIETRDYDSAAVVYENLYEHHHDRIDVLEILMQLYRQKRDYDNMLRCIELIEQVEGEDDELTLTKMNIYELKGDKEMAHSMLQSLVTIHPYEPTYKVMLGNWLLQNGDKDNAYIMLTAALSDDPDNETAQSSMYDYYRSAGQDSLATAMRNKLLLSRKTATKTKVSLLQQIIRESEKEGGESEEVLNIFDRAMNADSTNADIATLKALYMEMKGMSEDTVYQALAHVIDIAPDNAPVRLEMLKRLWPQQRWDDIIALCKPAVEYNPEEMAFYYFMGLAYYQKKDHERSIDALRRGVSVINAKSDPEIVSDFYAIMGDILYKKNMQDEAFAAYDSCLQWKKDNISCLNNYAYFLSELGRDLGRAERMSRKAVEAEPSNPTYLDTYAWIMFKQQRYSEAKTYIEQALLYNVPDDNDVEGEEADDTQASVDDDDEEESEPDSVIMEHAGDIYFMNGDTDKALEMWQQAYDTGSYSKTLPKKIKQKKYISDE